MRIGVAICCYHKHLDVLPRLLASIERQTVLPASVVVSCSSTTSVLQWEQTYSFPLVIHTHAEHRGPSFNRNFAARQLQNVDIISFIDADDEIHPQRLELIARAFLMFPDTMLVLHGLTVDVDAPFVRFNVEDVPMFQNRLRRCQWGATILDPPIQGAFIHNGHPSIQAEFFQQIQFSDHPDHKAKEDTVFCTTIVSAMPRQCVYIDANLSRYYPSHSQEF